MKTMKVDDHLGLQLLKLRMLLLELRQKAIEGFSMLDPDDWHCIRSEIDDLTCASRSCMACCLSAATSCSFCDSIDLAFCAIHWGQFLVLGQRSHVKLHLMTDVSKLLQEAQLRVCYHAVRTPTAAQRLLACVHAIGSKYAPWALQGMMYYY